MVPRYDIHRYHRACQMQPPRDGKYYVTKTLLGGEPDTNRRAVYRWPDDTPVCVFNQEMREWTEADEARLKVVVAALNKVDK